MMTIRNLKLPAPALREWTGPLTAELVREPGGFGLGQMPVKDKPASMKKAICGFCSTGCRLNLHLDAQGQAIGVSPDVSYPVNLGMACPKGWEAFSITQSADRATVPLLHGKPVDWATAATAFCDRFKAILAAHGPESVAFIGTGQLPCEELAFLGSFAKFGMGVIHGDGNTRQCMATSVVAYKQSFGFDAPPYTYEDFELSDCLVFVGGNPCIAHPIMWQRVLMNQRQPEIIVIDPRRTETAEAGTQHLAIKPKADLLLFLCLAAWLVREGKVDESFVEAHTEGFMELAAFLKDYAPENHLDSIGITEAEFLRVATCITEKERVSFWWTMGVNQSHEAVRTAQAIINVALLTGNIGKPGTGANSITGQCNAMGSRLFSNTTNLLGGHDFLNPQHREKVAATLGIPVEHIPQANSLAYDQILSGVEEGKIKGLWIVCTNPAHSWMQRGRFDALRQKLDFLVVQDMYSTTETALTADLLLPAAGWAEKDGTFINSERRISVIRQASKAPGQALSDFRIFRLLAEAWGVAHLFKQWTSPEAAFRLLVKSTAGQPCDISGIRGYDHLEAQGGIQWPWTSDAEEVPTQRRLFEDGQFFTPSKKAKFLFEAPRASADTVNEEYPLVLLTGRGTTAQWHTESRTGKSAILKQLHPGELRLEMHPSDAETLGLMHGSMVSVASRRGRISVRLSVSASMRPGSVFMPMHDPKLNLLTQWEVDPYSREPNYKYSAVNVSSLP